MSLSEQASRSGRHSVGPAVADGLFDRSALPAGRSGCDHHSGARIVGTTGSRSTVQAPPSATKQIPVPNGAPEFTLAGTGIHIVSARSRVVDDVQLSPGQCHARAVDAASGKFLPDPTCTPGAVDPGVTQSNLPQTICRSGYSSSVRAPATDTDKAKQVSLRQYGETPSKTTEYDHLISLELGGTNATSNLWPEPNATAATGFNNPKDSVENQLHSAVCSGQITLVTAQKAIAADWTTALQSVHP